MRRGPGQGSIYQRASDGLWIATVEVGPVKGRQRKTFSSKSLEAVQAKLDAWHALHPPTDLMPEGSHERRKALRKLSNAHTRREWLAKVAATERCPYCKTKLTFWNMCQDHIVPVARGGDSSIDNVTPCCKRCNHRKGTMTAREFRALLRGKVVHVPR